MTEKRYLDESAVTTFEATVADAGSDGVVLDRTYFYPTGGGQPHDTGVLRDEAGESYRVVDVRGRETVRHVVDGEPPEPGTTVTGEIDAARRRAHSRYHTAQHVLSAVLLDEFDAETTGNQLYADRARLDCAHERFDDGDLTALEAAVNGVLDAGHDVEWYTLDRETAEQRLDRERTRLDLLPDSVTEVRIVDIGGGEVDRTACAGTHVENTKEVGSFVVTGRETAGSGEERVRFELRES
ncbi:alanyl-tRNA editing protein [Halobacterium jilantaiense]|uniref:Misacylated tRNA(Ala) deacylase n=1 Tax=Halobacterium jilantaiense TaxID=355548 RepID=A0A1I0NMW3_9EURY|nr:alanyl-tRNA editing protein [Halobacterium jilantaiense]SEW02667.1 misacylated tRNA(Ala) deacylase [Halobacterium jilantaiense]